jgi:hypothetical protein
MPENDSLDPTVKAGRLGYDFIVEKARPQIYGAR